ISKKKENILRLIITRPVVELVIFDTVEEENDNKHRNTIVELASPIVISVLHTRFCFLLNVFLPANISVSIHFRHANPHYQSMIHQHGIFLHFLSPVPISFPTNTSSCLSKNMSI